MFVPFFKEQVAFQTVITRLISNLGRYIREKNLASILNERKWVFLPYALVKFPFQ